MLPQGSCHDCFPAFSFNREVAFQTLLVHGPTIVGGSKKSRRRRGIAIHCKRDCDPWRRWEEKEQTARDCCHKQTRTLYRAL